MKFLCVACDEPMKLQDAMPAEDPGTLAVVYTCGSCDHQIAMLTNPWETQMVQSLGIKIGRSATGEGGTGEVAGCPFSGMLEGMEAERGARTEDRGSRIDSPAQPGANPVESVIGGEDHDLVWTAEALSRLDRIPEFVRPMARQGIEHWARDHGWDRVTEEVLEAARGKMGM